jgi:tetratricopeptide (TPR) repeat protein
MGALTSCGQQEADSLPGGGSLTNLVVVPATDSTHQSELPGAKENKFPLDSQAPAPLSPERQELQDALSLVVQGRPKDGLAKVNAIIEGNPNDPYAYLVRARIHAEGQQWSEAEKDYEAVLQLDETNTTAKFDLSELKFKQKLYDDARPGFVSLESDRELGDLAAYKVFLCDLLAGHRDLAKSEFDAFTKADTKPSFYFGNAAWALYSKQPEEAQRWINTGVSIYSSKKVSFYMFGLGDLGIPIDPAP